ncbi:MAG TPA: glycosyltransferase family 9 protein [Solirubrobacteraceae bacterium]|jgi:ADP-heptose:LPS heptosyltransferase|nr:glycosyltransferase family 9 protein [Solirubrobacteraceae bacterium]
MIAILRALGLGDLLTATPALRGMARAFADERRVLYAPLSLSPLVARIDPQLELRDAHRPASLAYAGSRVRSAVNLHGQGPQSHRALLAAAPGARLLAFRNEFVRESWRAPRWRDDEHERARWCRLLAFHGISADPDDVELSVSRDEQNTLPLVRGATVLHPGAASPARRWPLARWAALARSERSHGHRVVITGSRTERPLGTALAELAGLPPDDVIAGRTSLLELAGVVAGAGRVVCGDTGVAHLATALRTPSVVLFGPVSPARWGPPPNRAWHISLWAGRAGDPHGQSVDPGLLAIGVDHAVGALARLPARAPPVPARSPLRGRTDEAANVRPDRVVANA